MQAPELFTPLNLAAPKKQSFLLLAELPWIMQIYYLNRMQKYIRFFI